MVFFIFIAVITWFRNFNNTIQSSLKLLKFNIGLSLVLLLIKYVKISCQRNIFLWNSLVVISNKSKFSTFYKCRREFIYRIPFIHSHIFILSLNESKVSMRLTPKFYDSQFLKLISMHLSLTFSVKKESLHGSVVHLLENFS